MIITDVGLEPHKVYTQGKIAHKIEYWIKVNNGGSEWFVNRDNTYDLDDALKKRDEMLDGIKGRRE